MEALLGMTEPDVFAAPANFYIRPLLVCTCLIILCSWRLVFPPLSNTGILDHLTETLREGLAGVKQELVEVKSLQLRAASATRHASSITLDDLTMVRAQSRHEGHFWVGEWLALCRCCVWSRGHAISTGASVHMQCIVAMHFKVPPAHDVGGLEPSVQPFSL
jgi:hypothetical protein